MSGSFGESRVFTQKNGPDVRLRAFGDEFYARYETLSGYSCIFDASQGLYCYAILRDGRFESTAVPIAAPPPAGVLLHLKEAPEVRNARFDGRFASMRAIPEGEPIPEVYGPNKGLLEGRQLNKDQVRGLAILVDFQDVQTEISADDVRAMLNAADYKANGNYCSVREYFRLMSSGVLEYSSMVVGPVRLSRERCYYVDHLLAGEALDLAVATGLDLSQFDSRKQGVIDAVSFLYAGETVWSENLWPHNSTVDWRSGGYRAGMYQITGLGAHSSDLVIGTYCHESGHMLCRFPDLYDYGKADGDFESSAGLGHYCLMSAGNQLNDGRTPAPVCAYLRSLAGWCPKRVSLRAPGAYQLTHGVYDTVHVYETARPNEYFLLENRGKFGLDEHLPSSGLAVYHCDTEGSNERQGGTAQMHYQCSLLQADKRLDLEQNANRGDPGDFFSLVLGEALSDSTSPSTKMWDGSDSGLRIANISAADKTITFAVLLRRHPMNGNSSSFEVDPLVLKHLQEHKDNLQANIDLFKLTQQMEQGKLKAEIDRVKAETDKQKAETDKFKALFPSGTTKPLSGETKTDEKYGYLARLAVFDAINKAARDIASRVRIAVKGSSPRIVLVDSLDFSGDDVQALQLSSQIKSLLQQITQQHTDNGNLITAQTPKGEGVLEVAPVAAAVAAPALLSILGQALAIAPGMISSAADIAGYFHVEDTYKSVEVTVPSTALQACVAGFLKANRVSQGDVPEFTGTVCFPHFRPVGEIANVPILSDYNSCIVARRNLAASIAQLKVLLSRVAQGNASGGATTILEPVQAAHARSENLLKAFDDFDKLVSAVPTGKTYSPLAAAAVREYLRVPATGGVYPLYLNVVSSGGEVEIRKTLWWTKGVEFLGGCVVTFALVDAKGELLSAGISSKLSQVSYKLGRDEPLAFVDLSPEAASGIP